MNTLSDQLMEERKGKMKPPEGYPRRENIASFREALNGTLRVAQQNSEGPSGTVDTLDISSAPSGKILVATSTEGIKLLDRNGMLEDTLQFSNRVTKAVFAPNKDNVAIIVFEGQNIAEVWDLQSKRIIYQITCHTD